MWQLKSMSHTKLKKLERFSIAKEKRFSLTSIESESRKCRRMLSKWQIGKRKEDYWGRPG